MANSNSRKHARKVTLDAAVSNAIEKAVDARKVAAFTVGAAGVLAGAAFAFGATPAMAAESGAAAAPTDATQTPVTADENAGAGKKADAKPEAKEADKKNQTDEKEDTNNPEEKKQAEEKSGAKQGDQSVVKTDDKKSDEEEKKQETTVVGQDRSVSNYQDREANQEPSVSNQINISKNQKDSVPNMYAWGSSDNVYVEDIQKHSVTFTIAKPDDGSTITNVAIFPTDTNGVDNKNSRKFLEYYSDSAAKDEHQSYSGTYEFKVNADGTATLTMNQLYTKGTVTGGASAYAANRCIYVYGEKDGKTVVLYKTNIARAATLVPPKTAGSIVLKYNEELTDKQIKDKLKEALDAPTEAKDKKTSKPLSVREQITAASKAFGVGGRTGTNNAFVQTPDDPDKKVIINDQQAYDAGQLAKINQVTSKDGQPTTYVAGAQTLKTYLISDLGFKSQALPLTVARYDTRIDKPIVDEVDINKLTDDQKADICKKLAKLNHVTQDKVKFNDQGEAVISFDGVDADKAPKIALKDLVLKKLKEDQITVPANDKAVIVANPLGYSKAELDRIKQSILDANQGNKELGLTSKDQITLEYIEGDTVTAGHKNQGISNGQAENKITVKIKTDNAVAEFTSDIKQGKLTRLPDIRKDYNVSWDEGKNKLDGRDSDEGLSWSNDKHTTIIYRYDPTAAKELKTDDIIKLLKATPKDGNAGLRDLTGGEKLDHEDSNGKPRKSHMHYALKDDEPTGELSLGNMSGAYWIGNQKVSHSDEKLGDNQSIAGSYSWDPEAGSVTVAGKKDKIYKARLFVQPYAMTYYKDVYLEQGRNPGNTAKAINIIFVPQTNHKTKDLKKSVDGHTTVPVEGKEVPTQPAYYNASDKKKEAYDKALDAATKLYAQVKDTDESKLTEEQKAQIDNATINLNKARAELDGDATKKEELKKSIDENGTAAQGSSAATGTQATNQFKNVSDPDFKDADGKPDTKKNEDAKAAKKAYDEALQAAEAARDDENATQKAVDDAKAKLDEARKKLNDFTTNKDELSAAIAKDGKVNTGEAGKTGDEKLKTADPTYQNSTKEERDAYDKAVAEAQKVVADPNASQKEVNEAIKKLKDAKAALDKNATDKSPLDAAVQKSFDNPDPTKPDKQSVFYKNAKAKTNDPDAQQVVKNYDDALKKAKEVLANDKATKADVEKAKKDLEDAEAALHADKYSTDKTDLGKALADNFSGYLMPAYFNAFDKAQAEGKDSQAAKDFKAYNDAYHAAKDLMDELNKPGSTVDQNKVDAVKKQLLDARKTIDKYATDTSKISAALLHSLAITKSPAYLNASAGAEGSEEAKAKKAYDDALKALQDAFNDKMPQDTVDGKPDSDPISTNNIPAKDGDTSSPDYLKSIQSHAKGQPLNRDVTKLLAKLNDAVKGLDKFKTKTDELIESINKDSDTHPSPAFKNASQHKYQKPDGSGPDDDKNNAAKAAAEAYGKALNEAKDLLKNPAATQKEVNDALKKLDDARRELDKYNTDTTKLEKSVAEHGKDADGTNPAIEGTKDSDAYRNASDPHFVDENGTPDEEKNKQAREAKAAYDKALAEAQALLAKHNSDSTPQDAKPTQAEIDAAFAKLDDARKTLVGDDSVLDKPGFGTKTTDLDVEIAKSSAADATTPTPGTVEDTTAYKNALAKKGEKGEENPDITRYKEALKKARELAEKQKSTKASERPLQKDVDEAYHALLDAKKIIADGYKTDATALQDEAALGANDGNFTKSPEYKNAEAKKAEDGGDNAELKAYKAALTEVKTMLNNFGKDGKPNAGVGDQDLPTQAKVNEALEKLSKARKAVEAKYKTKTDKLENEVGDKDETGQPVTPPFEASVAYKNALAKKDAESEEDAKKDTSATKKLKDYADKLKAAQDLIDKVNNPDPNAKPEDRPTQDDVDKALAALKKAKKDLVDAFKTNASALKNEAEDKDEHGNAKADKDKFEKSTEYQNALAKTDADSKKDVQTYQDALKKANELLELFGEDGNPKSDIPAGKQIPTQQEVDAAKKALKEIKEKILANYKTSPVDLQNEVDLSKDGDDDKRDGLFENTPAFKNADAAKDGSDDNADMKAYKDALEKAKKLLSAFNRNDGTVKDPLPGGMTKAPTQQELDAALKALQDAKKKIEDDYSTVKYDLRQEADDDFTKSPEYQNAQAKGDDASKQAIDEYKNALDEANSVLADPNATQAEVDAALKRLQDAKAKLKAGNSTDKSKLQAEADDDANFRKSPYFIIGNKADIEAYEDALSEARSVLADPNATQAQVDAALKKLEDAKKRILDFLSHFGGSGNGTGDWNGHGFVNGHESYGALVDKTALQIEVNNAVETNANTAEAVAYRQALAEAKSVLNDPNATQAQVDAALRKLQAAKAALLNSLSGASGHKIAKTGAATGLFAGFAVIFAGLGAAGVASRRRKHSKE